MEKLQIDLKYLSLEIISLRLYEVHVWMKKKSMITNLPILKFRAPTALLEIRKEIAAVFF